MTYSELIAKALKGRSINKAAQDWGMPQQTLDKYAKGRVPDFQTALILAKEAGVDPAEVMRICAEEEAKKKPRGMFAEMGYAAAAILLSVNLFLTPSPTEAAPIKASSHSCSKEIYLMLNLLRKLVAKLADLKRRLFRYALKPTAR